jgi:predicted O-methyltransferase YrrM
MDPVTRVVALSSVLLNVLLLADKLSSQPPTQRLLSEQLPTQPTPAQAGLHTNATTAALHDCASISCPSIFRESVPRIDTGDTYYPRARDRRWRAPPESMEYLTHAMYGSEVRVGELFQGFQNPYGKHASTSYRWTQLNARILDKVLTLLGRRVRFIVEVGSFAGGSAMVLGRFARALPSAPPVLCIDTWLGDLNMALGRVERHVVDKRHGEPTVYHQFLVNIIAANLTHHVLPMRVPSFLGATMLSLLGLEADLIYLDSAHELRETFLELTMYWAALAPGGVLMGDDLNWRAVNRDVKLFCRIYNQTLRSFDGCHSLHSFRIPGSSGFRTCVWYIHRVAPTDDALLEGVAGEAVPVANAARGMPSCVGSCCVRHPSACAVRRVTTSLTSVRRTQG